MLSQGREGELMTTQYLPLTEYSSKYKVSISTLRRRIKAEDISFVFDDGKYLIEDSPMSTHQRVHRPSQRKSEDTLMGAHKETWKVDWAPKADMPVGEPTPAHSTKGSQGEALPENTNRGNVGEDLGEEPVLAVANRLLTELKKAYSQILYEKEEQILHLKEEMSDLKTLVRVLESENNRLSRK